MRKRNVMVLAVMALAVLASGCLTAVKQLEEGMQPLSPLVHSEYGGSGPKPNLNTATREDLQQIPGLEWRMIDGLMWYRLNVGQLTGPDDLWKLPEMNDRNYRILLDGTVIQPVGDRPGSTR